MNDLKKNEYIKQTIKCDNGHNYLKISCDKEIFSEIECHKCGREKIEMAPFFYTCDFVDCLKSNTCVTCFRKTYSNWKILD
jgi:hypothetical protein